MLVLFERVLIVYLNCNQLTFPFLDPVRNLSFRMHLVMLQRSLRKEGQDAIDGSQDEGQEHKTAAKGQDFHD